MDDYKKALSTWLEGQQSLGEANHQYRISKLKVCSTIEMLAWPLLTDLSTWAVVSIALRRNTAFEASTRAL